MTILILYTELAAYTIASVNAVIAGGAEVHLLRWPVNAEAPFQFQFDGNIRVYERNDFTQEELIRLSDKIKPDLILCSGWNDKGYLAVCKSWFNRIPVVLAMDNKWNGGLKQQLARIVSGFTILKTFTHCWVPGEQQKHYALKLGFTPEKIKTGFYTCDTSHFAGIYEKHRAEKEKMFPHVFIYAGRYYEFKGVKELWSAFIRLKNETKNDWKLVCLGTGDIEGVKNTDIEHRGFVQPEQMAGVMKNTGVFILPSRFEPWAVVVQEFAAAGFPLLLSDQVGAGEAFLRNGENGFVFRAGDEGAIVSAMKKISELSHTALLTMGEKSHEFAMKNSPELWAQTLLSFSLNNKSSGKNHN